METRTLAEILEAVNAARAKNGKPPLKDAKAGKAKLLAALAKEEAAHAEAAPEAPVQAEAPTETPEALLKAGRCPHCGGDAANQTAAGAEGTFLGDACNECHDCGKVYNSITGEEIHLPARKTKKRVVLNPQSKIDAKVDALHDVGVEVTYDRPARLWRLSTRAGVSFALTSRQFSEYTPEELAKHATLTLGLQEKAPKGKKVTEEA